MRQIIQKELKSDNSDGLLKYIDSNHYIKSHVSISYYLSSKYPGDIESFFKWGSLFQIFNENGSVLLSYSFDSFSISLTNYSMRGPGTLCYAKSWELYGINKEKTTLIHKGDASSICDLNEYYCDTNNTKSFSIDSQLSSMAFSSLLFLSNNGSCTNGNHFAASGLEFFGTLYFTRSPCSIQTTINNMNLFRVLLSSIFLNTIKCNKYI